MKKLKIEKTIIDVQVYDLNRAILFYNETLGLPLIHRDNEWASLEAVGAEIHLYLHGGTTKGLEFRVSDIKKEIETLKSKEVLLYADENLSGLLGVDSHNIMEFPWGKAIFFKDTEGNRLTFVEDK